MQSTNAIKRRYLNVKFLNERSANMIKLITFKISPIRHNGDMKYK